MAALTFIGGCVGIAVLGGIGWVVFEWLRRKLLMGKSEEKK